MRIPLMTGGLRAGEDADMQYAQSDPICPPFFEQSIKVAFKHLWRPA